MSQAEKKYPKGYAEFSSFEDSEHEQRLRWASMTIIERFENCLKMMDLHGPAQFKVDDAGNEFLLQRK